MSRKKILLKGTFVLTVTGLTTRFMGFFYRIFLSRTFGETVVGIYQLIFPVYALGVSLSSVGIQISLSRSVAKYNITGNKIRARELLYTSIILTLIFSVIITLFLQKYSAFIAIHLLNTPSAENLLLLLSYIFPVSCFHSCIIGYYLGLKETKIPSLSQLIEQTCRIGFVFIFYILHTQYNSAFSIKFAVIGLIIGEFSACLFCVKMFSGRYFPKYLPRIHISEFIKNAKELLKLSLPLTASRSLLNILQSVEAFSIPKSLNLYGMDYENALRIYGVLTGMALPCILFPSAITNAVSTMLLPAVSEIQSLHDTKTLKRVIKKSILYCILLGSLCCIFFLISGNIIGNLFFNSPLAGRFILTLSWMCPFLYTNTTLISVINGIGKTSVTLIINILNLLIRILSITLLIPVCGIFGYLIGLLLSQFVTFLLCIFFLYINFKAEV